MKRIDNIIIHCYGTWSVMQSLETSKKKRSITGIIDEPIQISYDRACRMLDNGGCMLMQANDRNTKVLSKVAFERIIKAGNIVIGEIASENIFETGDVSYLFVYKDGVNIDNPSEDAKRAQIKFAKEAIEMVNAGGFISLGYESYDGINDTANADKVYEIMCRSIVELLDNTSAKYVGYETITESMNYTGIILLNNKDKPISTVDYTDSETVSIEEAYNMKNIIATRILNGEAEVLHRIDESNEWMSKF